MKWFRRKPRITEEIYGNLMTSFGRTADKDPFVWNPSIALAERVAGEYPETMEALDGQMWAGAADYHLRLLAASWLMAHDGGVPEETAEVFEEALVWKFEPLVKGSKHLPKRMTELANGEGERDMRMDVSQGR